MKANAKLLNLYYDIQAHLEAIEQLLPDAYKLTLLARNTEKPNADILMGTDEPEEVLAAIQRTWKTGNVVVKGTGK